MSFFTLPRGERHSSRDLIVLAQRRERRRRKKEIVDPKSYEELSSRSGRECNEINSGNPKSKNGKKSKLPAGLALMHGFSAENIGKRRLTVRIHFLLLGTPCRSYSYDRHQ